MNGAVPMLAIDGPSGAGKGTVAGLLGSSTAMRSPGSSQAASRRSMPSTAPWVSSSA